MQVQLKSGVLVLVPETDAETVELADWKHAHQNFAFVLSGDSGRGACLAALGPKADACREPINVHSAHPDPKVSIIANFAPTSFTLDGVTYASVEGFWQSLRFPEAARSSVAELAGVAAKRASEDQPYGSHVYYAGEAIPVGTYAHWRLMRRACEAKFAQNDEARAALLATGDRPLVHHVPHDSLTIPGVIMADIWMQLRARLRARQAAD